MKKRSLFSERKTKMTTDELELFDKMCSYSTTEAIHFKEYFDKCGLWTVCLTRNQFNKFVNHPSVKPFYLFIWLEEFKGDPNKVIFMNNLVFYKEENCV